MARKKTHLCFSQRHVPDIDAARSSAVERSTSSYMPAWATIVHNKFPSQIGMKFAPSQAISGWAIKPGKWGEG
jgi:hypothetical protein